MSRHDDDFLSRSVFFISGFIYGFLFMIHFIYERVFYFRYVFSFVVGVRVTVVSLLMVVALLSADFSKTVFGFVFLFLCGSDGGIDMITYSFLAQSFLTSILRVGVWIISRSFSLVS